MNLLSKINLIAITSAVLACQQPTNQQSDSQVKQVEMPAERMVTCMDIEKTNKLMIDRLEIIQRYNEDGAADIKIERARLTFNGQVDQELYTTGIQYENNYLHFWPESGQPMANEGDYAVDPVVAIDGNWKVNAGWQLPMIEYNGVTMACLKPDSVSKLWMAKLGTVDIFDTEIMEFDTTASDHSNASDDQIFNFILPSDQNWDTHPLKIVSVHEYPDSEGCVGVSDTVSDASEYDGTQNNNFGLFQYAFWFKKTCKAKVRVKVAWELLTGFLEPHCIPAVTNPGANVAGDFFLTTVPVCD